MAPFYLAVVYIKFTSRCYKLCLLCVTLLSGCFLHLLLLFYFRFWKKIGIVDTVLDILWERNGVFEIFLYQHIDNGSRPSATVSSIFDKYGDCYFRIFARSKCKKNSMVLAMWVLRRSRLTAHFHVGNPNPVARSAWNIYRSAHPLNNGLVVFRIYSSVNLLFVFVFNDTLFTDSLDKMWTIIKAAIRN